MFELARPWILFALPLPWLVSRYFPIAVIQSSAALKIPFFDAIQKIIQQTNSITHSSSIRRRIAYFIWFLLVMAAALPQWLGPPMNLPRVGRDMMLALDLSGSMQTPDMSSYGMPESRLEVVKKVATRFVQDRVGDRLGLILFGTRAYLQTPLTFDRQTVSAMVDDATVGLAGQQTAIGDAVGLAIKHLRNHSAPHRVLVLLTDGGNNSGTLSPLQAAQLAANEDIRIYTVGIGSDTSIVPGPFGSLISNPASDLDEETLQKMASLTGGVFFRAKDSAALRQAYHELDKLEPAESDKAIFHLVKPLYPWPLALSLLITVWLVWQRIGLRVRWL